MSARKLDEGKTKNELPNQEEGFSGDRQELAQRQARNIALLLATIVGFSILVLKILAIAHFGK